MNREGAILELCTKYSLPKRKNKKYDGIVVCDGLSLNDFIDASRLLNSAERREILGTPRLPQEVYRIFLNDASDFNYFRALVEIDMEPREWEALYRVVDAFYKKDDFIGWEGKNLYVLFAASRACPEDIINRFAKALKKIRIPSDPDPFYEKHYYSYLKLAKAALDSNLASRFGNFYDPEPQRVFEIVKRAQQRHDKKLAAQDAKNLLSQPRTSGDGGEATLDPESFFKASVKRRLELIFLPNENKGWALAAWGQYIGLPQFSVLPTQARLRIADRGLSYCDYYDAVAKLAAHPEIVSDRLATLSCLEYLRRDGGNLVRSRLFEALAKNPVTPSNLLLESIGRFVRHIDPECDTTSLSRDDSLAVYAAHSDISIRLQVALLPGIPKNIYENLSRDEAIDVREAVANNVACPTDILRCLSTDEYWPVRYAVALNPLTPVDVLEVLVKDGDDIRAAVARNSSTPPEILFKLAKAEKDYVRRAVAFNSSCPPELLTLLSQDDNERVRDQVLYIRSWEARPNTGMLSSAFDDIDTVKRLIDSRSEEALLSLIRDPCTSEAALTEVIKNLKIDRFGSHVITCIMNRRNCALDVINNLVDRILALEHERIAMVDVKSTDVAGLPSFLRQRYKKASEAERQALEAGDHLFFCGADADKAARSRHPIGIILALCSDKPIDDARLKILSKSDDWLIRASVARRNGLALSVREDLAGDEHPLVRALSKQGL